MSIAAPLPIPEEEELYTRGTPEYEDGGSITISIGFLTVPHLA